jgi:hypothetical protein
VSCADAHTARIKLFLHPEYSVRSETAGAERMAQDRSICRQHPSQLQAKLEFLKLHGWPTADAPAQLLRCNLSRLVPRVLFLKKLGCGPHGARQCLARVLSVLKAAAWSLVSVAFLCWPSVPRP